MKVLKNLAALGRLIWDKHTEDGPKVLYDELYASIAKRADEVIGKLRYEEGVMDAAEAAAKHVARNGSLQQADRLKKEVYRLLVKTPLEERVVVDRYFGDDKWKVLVDGMNATPEPHLFTHKVSAEVFRLGLIEELRRKEAQNSTPEICTTEPDHEVTIGWLMDLELKVTNGAAQITTAKMCRSSAETIKQAFDNAWVLWKLQMQREGKLHE